MGWCCSNRNTVKVCSGEIKSAEGTVHTCRSADRCRGSREPARSGERVGNAEVFRVSIVMRRSRGSPVIPPEESVAPPRWYSPAARRGGTAITATAALNAQRCCGGRACASHAIAMPKIAHAASRVCKVSSQR